MAVLHERYERSTVAAATLDEMWAYTESFDIQTRSDPRLQRVDVVGGQWLEAGCKMICTATVANGKAVTWEQEVLEVERPVGFVIRAEGPDGVSTGTTRYRVVDGGVEWSLETEFVSRELNVIEYGVARLLTPARRRQIGRNFERDVAAMNAGLEMLHQG